MASMNSVLLSGKLARDVEIRRTTGGTAVADLAVSVMDRVKNKNGEVFDKETLLEVVVWARQAETCAEYLRKGSPVLVEGRLHTEKWETQQGEKRQRLRIRAERVQFLPDSRKGATDRPPPAGA